MTIKVIKIKGTTKKVYVMDEQTVEQLQEQFLFKGYQGKEVKSITEMERR